VKADCCAAILTDSSTPLARQELRFAVAMGKKGATGTSHAEMHLCVRTDEGGEIVEAYIHPEHGKGKGNMTKMARTLVPRVHEYVESIKRVIHEEIQKTPADACYENHLAELAEYEVQLQDIFNDHVNRLLSCSILCDADMSFDSQRKWQHEYSRLEKLITDINLAPEMRRLEIQENFRAASTSASSGAPSTSTKSKTTARNQRNRQKVKAMKIELGTMD
jgi:hypothetical protein